MFRLKRFLKQNNFQPKDLGLFEDSIFVVGSEKPKYRKFTKDQRSSFPYWFWHWKAFNDTARRLGVWKFRHLFHDIEKPWLRLFLPYEKVQQWHRKHSRHHLSRWSGTGDDPLSVMKKFRVVDAIIDWECSRYTKYSAPLTARETIPHELECYNNDPELQSALKQALLQACDRMRL